MMSHVLNYYLFFIGKIESPSLYLDIICISYSLNCIIEPLADFPFGLCVVSLLIFRAIYIYIYIYVYIYLWHNSSALHMCNID